MKPTLIIGIGGSGMKIGHGIKLLFSKYDKDALVRKDGGQSKGKVKFLFFENDLEESSRVDKIKSAMQIEDNVYDRSDVFFIPGFNAHTIAQAANTKNGKKADSRYTDMSKWLDYKLTFPTTVTENGLRGKRQLGRMAFYLNYGPIRDKIQAAVDELKSVGNLQDLQHNSISVYIVTSICGGTGSSLYLDISTLLNDVLGINHQPIIKAVLINGNYYLDQQKVHESNEYKNLQINAQAFIEECEYYLKHKNQSSLLAEQSALPTKYQTRINTQQPYAPFTKALFFDSICSQNSKIPSQSMFSTIANILFYSITSESSDDWMSYIETNQFENNVVDTVEYSSLGYLTVRFPKEEFRRYFSYRYVYEIFTKILLKENPDIDAIERSVRKFVIDNFQDSNTGNIGEIFRRSTDEYFESFRSDQESVEFDSLFSTNNPFRYFENNHDLRNYQEILQTLADDQRIIQSYQHLLETRADSRIGGFDFQKEYNGRNTIADELRRQLWRAAYEVVKTEGYYGLVGSSSGNKVINGFLLSLKEVLKQLYSALTANRMSLESTTIPVENAKQQLLAALTPERFSKKKFKDIEPSVHEYERCLKELRSKYINLFSIKLKQSILYEFAVGDETLPIVNSFFSRVKSSATDLTNYRNELLNALGLTSNSGPDSLTLLNLYNSGQSGDGSIVDNFRSRLVNEFQNASTDVFTRNVPEHLSSFVDTQSTFGWKDGTMLDKVYQKITIDSDEFSRIFAYDESDRKNLDLITRLGESVTDSGRKIFEIQNKIVSYLEVNHFAANKPIGEFLNQTIIDVFSKYYPVNSPRLRQLQKELPVIYPIYSTHIAGGDNDVFINICEGAQYVDFSTNTFGISPKRIITNVNYENNRIVFLKYVDGIQFEDISGNKLIKDQYLHRNIAAFRPHLNYEWNNYIDGINGWHNDRSPSESEQLQISIGDTDKKMDYSQLLIFCLIMDSLQSAKTQSLKSIFTDNAKLIKNENLLCRVPIHYDEKEKKFVLITGYQIISDKGLNKFALQPSSENRIILSLSKQNIDFSSTLKQITKERPFVDVITAFMGVIYQTKTLKELVSILKVKGSLASIEKSCDLYKQILNTMNLRGIAKNIPDNNFAGNLTSNANKVLQDVFGIKLY